MNLILHDCATAEVRQGNTLTDPKFKVDADLKTFDFVVANPPFSDKRWSNGLTPEEDPFKRFDGFGIPPDKQGDYAYRLHIVRSLRSSGPEGTGRGACFLPHGVLFRGNAEAEIRKNLLQRGLIEGIIGLPPNLFFGTGCRGIRRAGFRRRMSRRWRVIGRSVRGCEARCSRRCARGTSRSRRRRRRRARPSRSIPSS